MTDQTPAADEVAGPQLRAITVFEPMAMAIALGRKTIENRYASTDYRGPLAIHAGAEVKAKWLDYPSIQGVISEYRASHGGLDPEMPLRAIVAVCRLVGAHQAEGCCKPWGMDRSWHWELADIVPLRRPVSMRGQQGLWSVTGETAGRLLELLP